MTISPVPSPSLPRERIPLPEGLTRLSDGALRVDGVDGTAVINPAAGSQAGGVSVETGLRVLQALGGTYLPTVGPAALSAPSPQDAAPSRAAALRRSDLRSMALQPSGIVPAEPSDETTLLRPITPISPISGSPQEAAPEPEPEPEQEQEPQPAPVPLEVPSPAAADSPTEVASPAQAPPSDEAPSSAEAATPAESDSSTDSAPELLETGVWEDPDDPVEPQQ